MGVYRLYTGADGESHIDELNLQGHPELREIQATSGIRLQEFAASNSSIGILPRVGNG